MGRGIAPEKWGRAAWTMLHGFAYVAARAPGAAPAVRSVLEAMRLLLPCLKCRRGYAEVRKRLGPPGDDLVGWVHAAHNRVNAELGRPEVAAADGLGAVVAAAPPGALRGLLLRAAAETARHVRACVDERLAAAAHRAEHAPIREAWRAFARASSAILAALVGEKMRSEGKQAGWRRCRGADGGWTRRCTRSPRRR
jgi:hypothetical protein